MQTPLIQNCLHSLKYSVYFIIVSLKFENTLVNFTFSDLFLDTEVLLNMQLREKEQNNLYVQWPQKKCLN